MKIPDKLTPAARRYIRGLRLRSHHTGEFPEWPYPGAQQDLLVQVLEEHELHVEEQRDGHLKVHHPLGRIYEFDYGPSVDAPATRTWAYSTTHDPITKKRAVGRQQMRLDFDAGEGEDGPPAPPHLWWDRKRILNGAFMSFDLETELIVDGELPPIAVMSAATEVAGEAVLVEPKDIVDFLLTHHYERPMQIWTGWNIASFDIPTIFYRIPWARERLYEPIFNRVMQGRLYDAMFFTMLHDIARYGVVYREDSAAMFPWFRGRGVYTLGTQARRWFGIELDKSEQLTFGQYVGRPRAITENQAAYVLGDSMVAARIMEYLYNHPDTWEIARKSNQEITNLKGLTLKRPDPRVHPPLHLAANLEYGWQTHAVQFMGAFALTWASLTGIEVDVDYTFDLLEDLEEQEQRLFMRLAGQPGRTIYKVNTRDQETTEVAWFMDVQDQLRREIYNRPDGSWPPEIFDRDWYRKWRELEEDPEKEDHVYYVVQPPPTQPADNKIAHLRDLHTDHDVFEFVNPKPGGRLGVKKGKVREYAAQYPLQGQPYHLVKMLTSGPRDTGANQPRQHSINMFLSGEPDTYEDRQTTQYEDAILQKKEWMAFFNTNIIAEFPDEVIRLNFLIAELQKKIATVKSYLPNWNYHPDRSAAEKLKLKVLRHALNLVGVHKGRVYPGFRALGAASGRTAAIRPNVQQVERDNRFRACFVAADNRKLVGADYATVEMATQGEIYVHRYGRTTLADYINQGWDVHLLTGMQFRFPQRREVWSGILGNEIARGLKRSTDSAEKARLAEALAASDPWFKYDLNDAGEDIAKDYWVEKLARTLLPESTELKKRKKTIKNARQAAKPVNFGIPGGMLPNRIRALAKTDYGVTLSKEEAEAAYRAWMTLYPEGAEWIKDGPPYLVHNPPFPFQPYYDRCYTLSGRLRGSLIAAEQKKDKYRRERPGEIPTGHDEGLNEWHNTQFQGQAADAAKLALFRCWFQGLLMVNFVHDEIMIEAPDALAREQASILESEMRKAIAQVVLFIVVGAAASIMSIWKK